MGSGRITELWLLAFLAFSFLTDVSTSNVMSAPNILRVGTVESIFVECQDCKEGDKVNISVISHPTKTKWLASTTVRLTMEKNLQALGQIIIPAEDFSKDPGMKQYVYLRAQFPGVELEKVVLVSFQSGYIFIQTDKTLYTPNSKVHYRIFAMTSSMKPVEKNTTTKIDGSIISEIVTPEGMVIQQDRVSLMSGIHSGQYQLGEIVSHGLWKVVTRFSSHPQQSYSAEFEVREYVLPSFEVKLFPEKPFFHVDSQELTVTIEARYLFGEKVDGMAFVVFGVTHQHEKRSIPRSLQKVPIMGGNGVVKLKKEHITETFGNIHDLVGSPIFVSVSVLTDSGNEMAEAKLTNIQIVSSPYTIHFKGTPKYFKPGMSFDIVTEVVNPDGSPAQGIHVIVQPGKQQSTTKANGMARLTINTNKTVEPLKITAKTYVQGISQASATMTALPYTTITNSYIHIALDATDIKLGDNMKVHFILNEHQNAQNYITYLILSRGQLVKSDREQIRALTSIIVPVTKELLPSFRIVAYYFTIQNEVVSDSLWVDVKDSCMGSLKLEPLTESTTYEPRKMFGLKVTGDPGAKVGLVAVDRGVYVLNNKHRLTQKKVWDLVEKHDTGCTPGGGKDAMSVFYDAGLLFVSSVGSGTSYRLDLECPVPVRNRRKRASTILDIRTSLVSKYKAKKQRDCCLEGMNEIPLSYNCERRSEYIVDDPECVEAFLHCCKKLEVLQAERKHDSLLLARSEEDESYMDSNEIYTRTSFPESWQWSLVTLPACKTLNCLTSIVTKFPLKDSITTWQFTGISLSRTHGICVADPLKVIVRKDFFIELKLPYSAVRGEQIEIKAILHNYNEDDIDVRVELIEMEHVCSSASRRGKYRQEIKVWAQSTRSVPFVIIPMKEGKVTIEVKAAVKDSWTSDGIRKHLLVVPEGILKTSIKSMTLITAQNDGKVKKTLNSEIEMKDLVPNSPSWTYISVTGREQIGALVENAISGKSMGTLIRQPAGCGEQNMIGMTLPVIATIYLDKTNQWETVGFEKRMKALEHIQTGYENELPYRKSDGSFAVFSHHQSSTWLTAYVAKVFAMAKNLAKVQDNVICDAIAFLISTQQTDGSFKEFGNIIHGEMIGDVKGKDSNTSMTAFCLIAMQESWQICNSTINNLKSSIDKAVGYLEGHLHNLTNPYAAAMTSYALANENKLHRQILFKFISQELTHWPVRDSQLFTLEATAYALLALVKAKAFVDAQPVVRWFNQQQIDGGGYGSTQATIMVYQAIAEYWIGANEEEYDVNVDIAIAGRAITDKINFNRENHYTTKSAKVNKLNQDVTVTATGSGEATVTMVSLYYALPQKKESDCTKFDLSVQLIPETNTDEKTYKLKIEVLFKNKDRDATMTILDIGMLTGFSFNTKDLNSLSTGYSRIIAKYEVNKLLSDKGSLIIYLDKVSHTQPQEIAFRIHQTITVEVLQPAAVSVYEYYDHQHNKQKPCVAFYHTERRSGELLRLCTKNECICAEENCSKQKAEKISNDMRTLQVCETKENKIDFVYKVKVENFTESLSIDIYTMLVVEVIKEGSYDQCQNPKEIRKTCDVGPLGKLRPFLSFQHCRAALNLEKGKTYLVMGMAKDIYLDKERQTYQYVLGQNTWIEYWPTNAECQMQEFTPICQGMVAMKEQYFIFGCQN